MADEADLAQERIEREQAALLAARTKPPARETLAETCADCGDPIPMARLMANQHTDLCSGCAADREVIAKRRKQRGW